MRCALADPPNLETKKIGTYTAMRGEPVEQRLVVGVCVNEVTRDSREVGAEEEREETDDDVIINDLPCLPLICPLLAS
jgi:hypothetical protein